MSETTDLNKMAMEKLIGEAKDIAQRLSNGSGKVESCPAHGDMAKGIKLCLDILIYQLVTFHSPRRQIAMTGGVIGVALFLDAVIRAIIAFKGGNTENLPLVKDLLSSTGG